jgi:hypothetical protein
VIVIPAPPSGAVATTVFGWAAGVPAAPDVDVGALVDVLALELVFAACGAGVAGAAHPTAHAIPTAATLTLVIIEAAML